MANKPAVQQFTSAWNKAAAWASSQGIPQSSYLPVYKMDYQRVKTGYWPMSAGERNRAILAAHNPNVVTPTPTTSNTDLWTPSAVWHHTVKDAGDIFTGLINLPTGLFDEVRNTMRDALDPSRLKGPTLGATIGNLLDTTLLNFLPGAADVGRYLQAGGGMAGIDKLMENPLLSALDVLPAELGTGVMAHLAETGAGAELAARAGMTTDQLANSGFLKVLKTVGLNTATKKIGVAAGGGDVKRLTVGDVIQNFAQSKVGVSGPIGDMMQAYSSITLKGTAVDQSIFAPAMDAVMGLSEADREIFDRVFTAEGKGVPLEEALKAPDSEVSQAVKEALRKTWTGPRRFNVEEAIAWEDVTVVRDSKGNELMYSADQHSAVVRARKIKQRALRAFVKTLDPMHKLNRAADEIESTRPVLADRLDQANQEARTAADRRGHAGEHPLRGFRAQGRLDPDGGVAQEGHGPQALRGGGHGRPGGRDAPRGQRGPVGRPGAGPEEPSVGLGGTFGTGRRQQGVRGPERPGARPRAVRGAQAPGGRRDHQADLRVPGRCFT